MVRVALLAFVPALLASVALGAPLSKRQVNFAVQDYAAFQISDGQTGNAKAEAAAIFVDPFANVDLATLDDSVATNMETMRKAAEAAETDQFNPAIDAAGGTKTDAGAALQNGKIKNKVLKLTAETQVLKIKLAKAQAAGDDTASISAKIAVEQKKLDNNIATDTKNAGQVSQGVTGGAAATTDTTGTDTTTTDTTDTSAAASASATTTKTKTGKKAKGTKAAASSAAAASSTASADASTATDATSTDTTGTDTTSTDTTGTDTTDTSAAASASATTTKTKTGKKAKGTKAASTAAASTAAASSDAAATATASASADASTATTATTGTNNAATATTFKLQDYAAFQISDGTAGDAQGKAEAIFVDPFDNVDLATLDDQVAKDIETMRQAAEAAETDKFNPAIDAAGGTSSADGAVLQAGKIQNKVLKLTAETQGLKIKIAKAQAAGTDTASLTTKLAAEQKKLDTNIATDEKNDGKASKGVA